MSASLVGSEMCIRDREPAAQLLAARALALVQERAAARLSLELVAQLLACLLYTSDAADDM
eukprot:11577447-Alexandrium_andersonii.AAC.1